MDNLIMHLGHCGLTESIVAIVNLLCAATFEWVENMQKEFCSPPTGFLGREIEKPVKIVLEGEVTE